MFESPLPQFHMYIYKLLLLLSYFHAICGNFLVEVSSTDVVILYHTLIYLTLPLWIDDTRGGLGVISLVLSQNHPPNRTPSWGDFQRWRQTNTIKNGGPRLIGTNSSVWFGFGVTPSEVASMASKSAHSCNGGKGEKWWWRSVWFVWFLGFRSDCPPTLNKW